MLVLIAVCFALFVSVVLRTFGDAYDHTYGPGWPIVQLVILLIVHCTAGVASWTAGYRTWSQRLMWLIAIHLHTITYALNWPVYQGLAGATDLTRELLPTLAAVALIILPSLLMYGGPVAAMINPPRREEK